MPLLRQLVLVGSRSWGGRGGSTNAAAAMCFQSSVTPSGFLLLSRWRVSLGPAGPSVRYQIFRRSTASELGASVSRFRERRGSGKGAAAHTESRCGRESPPTGSLSAHGGLGARILVRPHDQARSAPRPGMPVAAQGSRRAHRRFFVVTLPMTAPTARPKPRLCGRSRPRACNRFLFDRQTATPRSRPVDASNGWGCRSALRSTPDPRRERYQSCPR